MNKEQPPISSIEYLGRTDTFVVNHFAIHPEFFVPAMTDGRVDLPRQAFAESGLHVVIESLRGFSKRKFVRRIAAGEYGAEHHARRNFISISGDNETHLTLTKMVPIRGKKGYRGDLTRKLAVSATSKRFYNIVAELLE